MIAGCGRAFRAEWTRAFGTPGGRLAVSLPPLVAAARIGIGHLAVEAGLSRRAAEAALTGGGETVRNASRNAFGPCLEGIGVGLGAAALLLLAYGALAIAGERDSGTMRAALVRPVSRGAWVLGKVLVGIGLALAAMPAVVGASALLAGALYDFGPVTEYGTEIVAVPDLLRESLRGISAAMLAVIAVFAFGVVVSSAVRSPGLAVAAAMLGFLVFDSMKGLLGRGSEWVFATFVPSLVDRSYLAEVAKFAEGYSDWGFDPETWRRNLFVPPAQAALFVLAAMLVTRRRDA